MSMKASFPFIPRLKLRMDLYKQASVPTQQKKTSVSQLQVQREYRAAPERTFPTRSSTRVSLQNYTKVPRPSLSTPSVPHAAFLCWDVLSAVCSRLDLQPTRNKDSALTSTAPWT